MARRSKRVELDSLQAIIIHNKIMIDAIFTALEQKQLLTRDEVKECADNILNNAWPEFRWIH
jgi:hypothetical protein